MLERTPAQPRPDIDVRPLLDVTDRKGRLSAWLVVAITVVALLLAAPLASQLPDVEENGPTTALPRSADSTAVAELQQQLHADQPLPAVVVYAREGGLQNDDLSAVGLAAGDLRALSVTGEVSTSRSSDGEAVVLTVPLDGEAEDLLQQVADVRARVQQHPDGLQVAVTGPAGGLADQVEVFQDLDVTLLLVAASVVALLLLFIYRSPVLWLLPLVTVAAASMISDAAVYLLARYADVPVDGQSRGILPVLVFGVGTDYSLLLIARYREELRRHESRYVAMRRALRRTGPAVLGAAASVVLGLLCLSLADINSTRSLGVVAAVGVSCAVLALLTLLPALLVVLGRWLFWPFVPRAGQAPKHDSQWPRVATVVSGRPRLLWAASTGVLAMLTLGVAGLDVGLTAEQQFRTAPESVTGQQVLAEHFPAGMAAPVVVVTDRGAAANVTAQARGTKGVVSVQPAGVPTGNRAVLHAVLAAAPSSAAAESTVQRLRDRLSGTGALVGGPTAEQLDIAAAAARDRRVVMPLVLGVVLLTLLVLLRALLAPVLLLATVVLSYAAALGAATVLLDQAFGITSVDTSLPLLGFLFVVVLGVDYTLFLMTRAREECLRLGHRDGMRKALISTGGVITSAGVVLAATFAVLTVPPLVFLTGLGVVVSIGVLLDTFLVRSLLVPALALDVGPRLWWPSTVPDQPLSSSIDAPSVGSAPAGQAGRAD